MQSTVLFVFLSLILLSGGWTTSAVQAQVDENQLMSLFAPPQQQQSQSPLEAWQAQQAGMAQPQQQQQAANGGIQALLSGVAALLQAVASTTPAANQAARIQAAPIPPAATMFAPPSQNPNVNLYGAQQPQQQQQQDVSLIENKPASNDIFPLSHGSGYGFDRQPADVQAAMKRAQPKPVSDVDRFGRIPNRKTVPRHFRNHFVNLESEFQHAPERMIPVPHKQAPFKIRTHKRRMSLIERQANANQMKNLQEDNPFLKDEQGQSILLALGEAEQALQDADSTMKPITAALQQQAQTAEEPQLSLIEQSASTTNTAAANAKLEAEAVVPKAEFAPRAVPSANFSKMFQSIMSQVKRKHADMEQ